MSLINPAFAFLLLWRFLSPSIFTPASVGFILFNSISYPGDWRVIRLPEKVLKFTTKGKRKSTHREKKMKGWLGRKREGCTEEGKKGYYGQ